MRVRVRVSQHSDALLHLTQSFGMGLASVFAGGAGGGGAGGGAAGGGIAELSVDLAMTAPSSLGAALHRGRAAGRTGTGRGAGGGNGTGGGRGGARSSVAELRLRATLGLARVALQRGEPQRCLQLLCDAPGHEPHLDPRVCRALLP